jgi:glutaminyl-tRNA synthetase
LEFEVHRPLYDWFCKALEIHHPQQIEFARLNLNYTIMSKRKLLQLVEEKYVLGWDDPRMPTISGLRRRGYSPEAIRNFAETVGVAKRENIIDVSLLEFCAREHLNKAAIRTMAVLDPVKLIIDNYPEEKTEMLQAVNNPEDLEAGAREIPFGKVLYIERADFKEDADKNFFRLTIDREVRLKYAYIIKCTHIVKDAAGNITEIHSVYDPETKSSGEKSFATTCIPPQRKVKAAIHWIAESFAKPAEIRLFERLFTVPEPDNAEEGKTFIDYLNSNSLTVINGLIESNITKENAAKYYQFERIGYFCMDKDSTAEKLVFNKTVGLKQ